MQNNVFIPHHVHWSVLVPALPAIWRSPCVWSRTAQSACTYCYSSAMLIIWRIPNRQGKTSGTPAHTTLASSRIALLSRHVSGRNTLRRNRNSGESKIIPVLATGTVGINGASIFSSPSFPASFRGLLALSLARMTVVTDSLR